MRARATRAGRRRAGYVTALVFAVAISACNSDTQPDEVWGRSASAFFEELSDAYTASDYYGVLDFYGVDAFQEKWRGDIQGGLLVRDLLLWDSGNLAHEVVRTYVGPEGAITLVAWEQPGGLSLVMATIVDGHIAHEVVYDHSAWLEGSLRVAPSIVRDYIDLYEAKAREERREAFDLSLTVNGTPLGGPAVFLGPGGFSEDPSRAIGLFRTTDPTGCEFEQAVSWQLDDGQIEEERVLVEVPVDEDCVHDPPTGDWWLSIPLPMPRDQIVTHVVTTDDGSTVEIINGNPDVELLIRDALDRFTVNGLDQPVFDSVTFEPSRKCEQRSGRLIQEAGSRDIFLCLFAGDLCPADSSCDEPQLSVRANVLHEMAHAWILDHTGQVERTRLLEIAELEHWDNDSVPWPERGVEYAAEVLTWGLLDEWTPMVRIGRPDCDELAAAFEALTSTVPNQAIERCEAGE